MTLRSVLGRETSLQLLVPLTSALASMILFEVGAGRYALPAASVIELAGVRRLPEQSGIDGPAIRYGGMLVPLLSLTDLLDESPGPPRPAVVDGEAAND